MVIIVGPMFAMRSLIERWYPRHKDVRLLLDGSFEYVL